MKTTTKYVESTKFKPFQIILQFDTKLEIMEFKHELNGIEPKSNIPHIVAIINTIDSIL